MGATSVLMASELELPDNVFGIAADSAFTSLHAIWKHVSESNLHIPYALHKTGADRMCKKRIQMDADAASTTEALKHCQIPVLFVHGTDDHFVPVEMTYENYKACRVLGILRTAEKESVDLSLKGGNHYAPALAPCLIP